MFVSSDLSMFPVTNVVDVSAALMLLSGVSEGIFTRVTMTSMSAAWYKGLSPSETLMMGLLVLQVVVMRLLQILPLDFTNLIATGELIGRRRRKRRSLASANAHATLESQRLAETVFTILRRIDQYDCLLRGICELQQQRTAAKQGFLKLPKQTEMTLSILQRSGQHRSKYTALNNETVAERPVQAVFEEAVITGFTAAQQSHQVNCAESRETGSSDDNETQANYWNQTSTVCQAQYALCPLSTSDIFYYIQEMGLENHE